MQKTEGGSSPRCDLIAAEQSSVQLTTRITPENILRAAAACVAKLRPAISGQQGHNSLYRAACLVVDQFSLLPHEAWPILLEFNKRCCPPWSRAELIHKLCDAYKNTLGMIYTEPGLYRQLCLRSNSTDLQTTVSAPGQQDFRPKPDVSRFVGGTEEQLATVSALRGISVPALRWASARGVLIFGYWFGMRVFGIKDQSGNVLEIRRLDGQTFPAIGTLAERKSHALRGSRKHWPVGILEAAPYRCIALVEGLPDFLAAHDLILRGQGSGGRPADVGCAPVALLSANVTISEEALPHFKGKTVRIFYHCDPSGAGWRAARRWQQQIVKAGAHVCDFFDFGTIGHTRVCDLNDYLSAIKTGLLCPSTNLLPVL